MGWCFAWGSVLHGVVFCMGWEFARSAVLYGFLCICTGFYHYIDLINSLKLELFFNQKRWPSRRVS